MYQTIFFDLDGTLLDLDMDDFLPKYFRALTARFQGMFDPQEFVDNLLASTDAMIKDKNPEQTNEEVFMEDFLPRLNIPQEELLPILVDFYSKDFGSLGVHATREPLAVEIVGLAVEKGLDVVIATNPVFPRMAIDHRLQWAGVEKFEYQLVTSYEIMHFCKPHREYYQEIVSVIGKDPQSCLMVGNDVQEDLPARAVGLDTFLVENHLINRTGEVPATEHRGDLEALYQFIKGL